MKKVLIASMAVGVLAALPVIASAAVSGKCDKCHTMHNSQNDSPMTLDGSSSPNQILLRGSCIQCHGGSSTSAVGTNDNMYAPRVYVNSGQGSLNDSSWTWLPGGYFNLADTDTTDSNRHNVYDLEAGCDSVLNVLYPPGYSNAGTNSDRPADTASWNSQLTCAGTYGCHGWTAVAGTKKYDSWGGIAGHHHGNDSPYRYLRVTENHTPVKGTGVPWATWLATPGASQNIYFANDSGSANAPTISRLCGECHGKFHAYGATTTIGEGTTFDGSNWLRHPTDLQMTSARQAARATRDRWDLVTTSNMVPVASNNDTVAAVAGEGYVICLSCHVAHGGAYKDLLRWSYTLMSAGTNGAGAGTGCFVCHSTKDQDHQ